MNGFLVEPNMKYMKFISQNKIIFNQRWNGKLEPYENVKLWMFEYNFKNSVASLQVLSPFPSFPDL